MKPLLRTFLLGLGLLSILNPQLSTTFAQGTSFTYQGVLTDASAPANGVYDLSFTLFNAASGGGTVSTSNVVNDLGITNGLFTVALDFGSAPFDGGDRWVQVAVRLGASSGNYIELTPRQQITSTPYAIRAANLSGTVAASQLTGTISSSNIGAGSITTVMLAPGSVGSNQLAAGAVTTGALADGAVTAAKVATVVPLLTVFTNPTPATSDFFGESVAAVGTDRILIGARDDAGGNAAGAAYLFSASGTLLTTFTNPTPADGDLFGVSVAAVGTDRVLIGAALDDTRANDAGAAYLFNTNGALLTTFTKPSAAASDYFGVSVAAVGTDRVLIGTHYDDTGASAAGAAYLFGTNGALLMTFSNPTPVSYDQFGSSVAAVGTDQVLIGAPWDDSGAYGAGAAYLFSTNGALLTTITNPTPGQYDNFGSRVAALGTDRVLITANRDSTGAIFAGAAYLFSTNGTLLTTINNPTPTDDDYFGTSVAAVGTDRVLIGATGAVAGGAAYLFNTNGMLLVTYSAPTPAYNDLFGGSVAALGTDWVVIGALRDDTGATDAGAAYLFGIETYTPGLIADGVNARSITTASLEDGAVTAAKLDPAIGVWTRSGDDVFRLAGKVGIGTSSFTSNRLEVAGMVGATAFNTTSDRAAKQDFTAVDAQAVLARVAALPITQWRFKDFPGALHLGPMAQDFRAAFGLGLDDKSIATVDADGVALAAIQGLNQKVEEKDAKITELEKRLAALEQVINNQTK